MDEIKPTPEKVSPEGVKALDQVYSLEEPELEPLETDRKSVV